MNIVVEIKSHRYSLIYTERVNSLAGYMLTEEEVINIRIHNAEIDRREAEASRRSVEALRIAMLKKYGGKF